MNSSSRSSARPTVTDRARRFFAWFINPMADALMHLGLTPNTLTCLGFLANVGVGLLAATGNLIVAGLVFFVSGLFDGLDGALARRIGVTSKFGAFLDSTLDRYSEAFVLFGVFIYSGDRGLVLEERLVYATLVGSLLISYTRARAEGLGLDCKIGLLTRFERFFLMAGMLILQQVTVGLLILSILTHLTAIQRIIHVWRATRSVQVRSRE
ncbi:MAG TPA: CDP-alcohol phosphatidyltransferase family protein [Anaerolineae bacterium]|nr:CDP-alcohol phosphatidyltransferase family protein [Anaerolineae bacterium]